jgi:UDP-N-acetylglucosamine 2-epimerase (non-hydrolysing)/UDP-GlcNAc3NAcA epimerase
MLAALEPLLTDERPDIVLVYGDTNSTLAGALAGAQTGVPVAHVEAGMRSFDRSMPEELNRALTDRASALLLCSSEVAVENLVREAVAGTIELVGDVMVDVALTVQPRARERTDVLDQHAVVLPLHPRTRARLEASRLLERVERAHDVRITPPLGYVEFTALVCNAGAVLTDSGGLQKEAYLAGVPCITLRPSTEWSETVDHGWNVLVDLDAEAMLDALQRKPPSARPPLYGDGNAGERVVAALRLLGG